MQKKLVLGLVAISALVSNANAITTELALAIDDSGSIGVPDFENQRNGYINALNNIFANPAFYGQAAIAVYKFADAVVTVFPATEINTPADLAALTAALAAMPYTAGSTALGPAIQQAAADLLGNGIVSSRQVIDVSTDGGGNVGVDQVTASNAALAAGIEQINGLGVGASANLNFVGGAGSFAIQVTDYGAPFQNALEGKLTREIIGTPDGGSSLALLALGVLGVGAAAQKRGSRSK
jgi:hypothetical protein